MAEQAKKDEIEALKLSRQAAVDAEAKEQRKLEILRSKQREMMEKNEAIMKSKQLKNKTSEKKIDPGSDIFATLRLPEIMKNLTTEEIRKLG